MKSATIQDIATLASVSKATVSRVLNDTATVDKDKRKAVLAAIKQLDYQPNTNARSLAGGRSMTIGVLTQAIGGSFYDTIARGLITALAGTGYSPIFVDGQWQLESEMKAIDSLLARQVDGLVLIGGDIPGSKLVELYKRCPTIVVGRDETASGIPSYHVDNVNAGYLATKHLIDFGHVNIAMVCGDAGQPDAVDRQAGYEKALRDANIPVDPNLICDGNFLPESGVVAIESLIAKRKLFSAVFAANDLTAMGIRLALYRYGLRVPEDISIVGIDDQAESSYMTPPLTTVRQPATEIGTQAAHGIVRLLNRRKCESAEIPVELQVRGSAGRRR